jgi:hypothetical protein
MPMITTQTLDEWMAEADARYGGLATAVFVCPKCGHKANQMDFISRALDEQLVYQECLGRYDKRVTNCDFAAGGVLGTMGQGRFINLPEARTIEVFNFA